MTRETLLARTFVELADTLVEEFDVVDLLTMLADRCVDVLGVSAAGLMLAAPGDELRAVASSSEEMRMVELFELQSREGPCLDCYHSGTAVLAPDLAAVDSPWPRFASVALSAGFGASLALPMRLRGATIGALNMFWAEKDAIDDGDVVVAQALADVATIAILQNRAIHEAQVLNEQLNHALNSRVVIEQAKGVLAEQAGLDMDHAFSRLRNHARNHNLGLADVARDVVDGRLNAGALDPPRRQR
jgi:GAF domain-containing protein